MSFSQAENAGGVGDFQDRSILLLAKSVAKAIMSTSLEVQGRGSAGVPKMARHGHGFMLRFKSFANRSKIKDQYVESFGHNQNICERSALAV